MTQCVLNVLLKEVNESMIMPEDNSPGDCDRIPDGRIARVRDRIEGICRVRARRKTSQTYQFLELHKEDLYKVEYPKGWMSPEGYNRYLKITLEKMRARNRKPVRRWRIDHGIQDSHIITNRT